MKTDFNTPRKRDLIIFIGILLIIPFLINILFKFQAPHFWLEYEQSAGDVIGIYVAFLSFIGTVILGYVAYKQNERLLQLEIASKKPYALLCEEKSSFVIKEDLKYSAKMSFDNISEIPIVEWKWDESEEVIMDGLSRENIYVDTTIGKAITFHSNSKSLELNIESFCTEEKRFVFSFILVLENLYEYKTKLLINVLVCPIGIAETKVRVQE